MGETRSEQALAGHVEVPLRGGPCATADSRRRLPVGRTQGHGTGCRIGRHVAPIFHLEIIFGRPWLQSRLMTSPVWFQTILHDDRPVRRSLQSTFFSRSPVSREAIASLRRDGREDLELGDGLVLQVGLDLEYG